MDYRRSTHHETNESNNPSAPVMYPQSYGNFSPYGGPRNEVEMTLLPQPEPPPRADRPITIQSVEKAINDGIKRVNYRFFLPMDVH
ncbi:unnamed protein product [Didymodactylos carnosus]|uniref:Uncharacterized protein n=1 Tax=Didymodactylos carnosus TaxID=1234261 RepID=A0A8S2DJ59_9BILA|nr:unnamed protein product [Didymodactylos carnosus]CAF3685975.1 unnamed protein product [Didymodactylos carnosus]